MAVAIPIINAFATIATAGSVAAAVGTVGGFLSVAGGVLAGVGALTGNKDLARLGGLMALGSGIANLAGAASGAGAAAGGAEAAAEEAAKSAFRTSELTAAQTAPELATAAPSLELGQAVAAAGDSGTSTLMQAAEARAGGSLAPVGSATPTAPAAAAAEGVSTAPLNTGQAMAGPDVSATPSGPLGQPADIAATPSASPQVANAGQNMTQNDLQKYLSQAWDRTQSLLKNTSGFLRDNKELVSIVGNAFSPQAEQLDWQKSLYNRRRASLNSPIALGPRAGA